MGSHDPFRHLKHKLWPNWQFDSRPLKVMNWPNFLACRQRATCRWKTLDEGYNFGLDLISIGGLHTKLRGVKVVRVPMLLILGVMGQKTICTKAPLRGAKYTIWAKVVASLESGPWWIFWVQGRMWLILAPKVLQLCTNHFVLVLCRSV
jgi:hypothetical protein